MKQINISLAKVAGCFREVMRINKAEKTENDAPEYTVYNEGNALIDPKKTPSNYELIPPHPALNPSKASTEDGKGLAEYVKSVTGRYPRMHGQEKQLSKAVGVIITLPRDYIVKDHELTNKQFAGLMRYLESGCKTRQDDQIIKDIHETLSNTEYSRDELERIKKFFKSALRAWQINAGIRDEDMLYAVVHMDETFPHLHIMALPSLEKEILNKDTGRTEIKHTFSTDKFNNRRTHYFDRLHQNIIDLMREDGIDASSLLNGATQEIEYNPNTLSRNERKKSVEIANSIRKGLNIREDLKKDISSLESKKTILKQEISGYKNIIPTLKKEYQLSKKEADALAKDKGVLSVLKNRKTETIKVTPDIARKLTNSVLEYNNLKKRETDVTKRENEISKIIKAKVKELLPKRIQKYDEEIIPRVKEVKHKNAEKAKELEKREAENAAKEEALLQKQQELNWAQENINRLIKDGIRKRLNKIVLKKIEELLGKVLISVQEHLLGKHQQSLIGKIKELNLPEDFIVEGKDYGKKSIDEALRQAETLDIRQAIIDSGIHASDIEASDVANVRKALAEGTSIKEAASKIADNIRKSLEDGIGR